MIDSTFKNAKILVVDDMYPNIALLEGLLDSQDYVNFKSTTDPRKVVEIYKSFQPDLILLDLMMPYLSGYDVMKQLKEFISDEEYLPILVLTADMSSQAKKKALSKGAKDFLVKPFDFVEVGLRIENLLFARYLFQQQKFQNQILEIKVKERTAELERTNSELIIAKEKAEASDRLKTAFMNNISHEIRTPLNGILGFAPFIIDPDVEQEEKEFFLQTLNRSSQRLINTINDYMDISLIVSDNMEKYIRWVDISLLMSEIADNFKDNYLEKNLEFKITVPKDIDQCLMKTDSELLQKALFHLIENAFKFTNQGSIEIGFNIHSENQPESITFFVKDTGKGMSSEAKKIVFNTFTQGSTSNSRGHEGSGLGLSIVKGITQLLQGTIILETEENEGTRFYLTFPIDSEKSIEHKNIAAKKNNGKAIRTILIVDDENVNSLFLKTILSEITNNILIAEDGYQAIDLCKKHPEIDLILMDIKMPKKDGYETTQEIRKFNQEVVIIAQTSYALSGDVQKAIQAGCNEYISKPISKSSLMRVISQIFG